MQTVHRIQSAALLIALAVPAFRGSLHADDAPRVRIGLEGSYKVGFWTSIDVEFDAAVDDANECHVIVPDADGNPTIAPLTPVSAGRYAGEFRSGRLNAPIRVRTGSTTHVFAPLDDGDENEPVVRPARQSVSFLGVVGSGDAIEQAVAELNRSGGEAASENARLIRFPDWNALPPSGRGWDALDVLFVAGDFPDTESQSEALRNWVRRGGHLVLSIGERSDAFQSSPIADWSPGEISGSQRFNELLVIVDRVPGAPPLIVRGGVAGARIDPAHGIELLSTFEGTLVARFAYGIGRVTVFALDFQAPPMSTWDGTPKFCLYLADLDMDAGGGAESQLRMSGVSDLATQLAASLDWFPAAVKPSYSTVLAAVLCFLLIVGPLDYLLVHRVLKRPRRTWITFPAAVLLAACFGAVVAQQSHSQQMLLNRLEIIDVDVSHATVRVRDWATLYSPAPQRQQVEFTMAPWMAGESGAATRASWFGKPESGFRGMYRTGGLDLGNPEYAFSPGYASILNLPIDQWSTKSLSAEWEQKMTSGLVDSTLADDGNGELTGSLTHHLPGPITDWMLAYGAYVYFAGSGSGASEISVPPGVPLAPAEVLPVPRLLERILVGYHNVVVARDDAPGGNVTTTPGRRVYDPLNRDPMDLVRTITFHDAAGGHGYTGLNNATLARSDLSAILPLHRAVLLARVTEPAMRCDAGDDVETVESSTFIRIILPVERASSLAGD